MKQDRSKGRECHQTLNIAHSQDSPPRPIRDRVDKATVTLLEKGGRGVFVRGGVILTPSHCVAWTNDGTMGLNEYRFEKIMASDKQFTAEVAAVEPVHEIAILVKPGSEGAYAESIKFEEFSQNTKPLKLFVAPMRRGTPIPVFIFNHRREWIKATVTRGFGIGPTLMIEADEPIEAGDSGSPIITESGELVAVASTFNLPSSSEQKSSGIASRPHLALPVWVCCDLLHLRHLRAG